jgi:hypothetical protein
MPRILLGTRAQDGKHSPRCYSSRTVNPHRCLLLNVTLGVLLLGGCEKEAPVASYAAPKEQPTISWDLPAGWRKVPPSSNMLYAAFAAGEGDAGATAAQVTLSFLLPQSEGASDLLANVNRWRRQLGLPPADEAELNRLVDTSRTTAATIQWVDLNGTAGQRTRAAIVPRENRIWFFKMTGTAEAVAAHKDEFDAFVKSAKFLAPPAAPLVAMGSRGADAPAVPADHPPIAASATGPSPSVTPPPSSAGTAVTAGDLKFTLPAGWSQQPGARAMRVATLSTGGDKAAEVIITRLSSSFGGMLMNVNRWRGEVGLPPVQDASAVAETPIKIASASGAVMEFSGPGKNGAQPTRSLVARCTQGESVWFFKILGPAETVSQQRKAFDEFLASVQFQKD